MHDFSADSSETKTYRFGAHRTLPPEDTIARLRPLMSNFGITRIANPTSLVRTSIPVVMVCRPNARSSAVFHGKGVDIAPPEPSGDAGSDAFGSCDGR